MQVWLGTTSKVFEGLSEDFAEYRRLAAQSDPEYRAKFLDDRPEEDTTKTDEPRNDLTKPGWSWRVVPFEKDRMFTKISCGQGHNGLFSSANDLKGSLKSSQDATGSYKMFW